MGRDKAAEYLVQLLRIFHTQTVGCEAGIIQQVRPADGGCISLERSIRAAGEGDIFLVTGHIDVGRGGILVLVTAASAHDAKLVIFDGKKIEQAEGCLGQGKVNLFPFGRFLPRYLEHRGENGHRTEHAAKGIGNRVASMHRRTVRIAGDMGQAAHGLENAGEAGFADIGAGLAESSCPQHHEFRVCLP